VTDRLARSHIGRRYPTTVTTPDDQDWADLDIDTPNPARMYDYLLGGAANFAADRAAARRVLEVNPAGRRQVQANRAFLRRVVRRLAGSGVRQFLDLGSGIPTVGNVHEIVLRSAPDARVVYVDSEPIAASYSRRALAGVPGTAVVRADIRDVDHVLGQARELLDLDEPVAVLMFSVLHFILDDDEVRKLVGGYRNHSAPGSWLAISHGCADDNPGIDRAVAEYQQTSLPGRVRSRAAITELFDGYELVEPGLVYVSDWHPDPDTEPEEVPPGFVGGLARAPAPR
jgi:hypothetical protein